MGSRKIMQHNYDFHPCFYETETDEEFYRAPMPSDDIWKKFDLPTPLRVLELLPTPPRSPIRDSDNLGPSLDTEKLEMDLVEYINNDSSAFCNPKPLEFPESPPLGLQSNLIQDCMWSGKLGASSKSVESTSRLSQIDASATCVDPSSVFPFPINRSSSYNDLGTETPSDSEEEIDVVTVEKRQARTPAVMKVKCEKTRELDHSYSCDENSDNITESLSDDFDDLPLQPPKEVVRVITPSQASKCKNQNQKSMTLLIQRTSGSKTVNLNVVSDEIHNYSLPPRSHSSKRTKISSGCSTPNKRVKRELGLSDLKSVAHKLKSSSSCSSSRSSSDSEEGPNGECKRAQHNVLERKRRNDLKYSFYVLRDQVPDLSGQQKAAKVAILKKATDCVYNLTEDHAELVERKKLLQARNETLKQILSQLEEDADFYDDDEL